MDAKKLIKGKEYWYTAGAERVRVVYLRETVNGFLFTDGTVDSQAHRLTVEKYIEEIK